MSSETITRNDLANILNEIVAIDGTDMTAQEISDFVDSLNVTGINAVDYVVENGAEGIWTYRKWNSGKAECWGTTTVASNAYSASGGYKQIKETLPTGLFNTTPLVLVSGKIASNAQTSIGYTSADSATQVQTYLINRGTSAITSTGAVYWQVIGTWK